MIFEISHSWQRTLKGRKESHCSWLPPRCQALCQVLALCRHVSSSHPPGRQAPLPLFYPWGNRGAESWSDLAQSPTGHQVGRAEMWTWVPSACFLFISLEREEMTSAEYPHSFLPLWVLTISYRLKRIKNKYESHAEPWVWPSRSVFLVMPNYQTDGAWTFCCQLLAVWLESNFFISLSLGLLICEMDIRSTYCNKITMQKVPGMVPTH